MPRTITALSNHESDAAQIPVSLVRLEISGAEQRIHDLDVSLYFNPTTGACSLAPGAGLLEFTPAAGLGVPQISSSDSDPYAEIELQLANQEGDWYPIIAVSAYHGATATIWQGNIVAGAAPYEATFVGAVKTWAGEVMQIVADDNTAAVRLGPPDILRMPIPRRTYAAPEFTMLPSPGLRVKWGYSEKTI